MGSLVVFSQAERGEQWLRLSRSTDVGWLLPGLRKSFASSFDQSAKDGYLAFDVLLDRPAKESNDRD